jgi:hypothetical protein
MHLQKLSEILINIVEQVRGHVGRGIYANTPQLSTETSPQQPSTSGLMQFDGCHGLPCLFVRTGPGAVIIYLLTMLVESDRFFCSSSHSTVRRNDP